MNVNAQASEDFLVGSRPVPVSTEDKTNAVRAELEGLIKLANFLVDKAKVLKAQRKEEWRVMLGEADVATNLAKHLRAEIEAIETASKREAVRKKYPNFFERQLVKAEANALGKSEETVLADRANLATAPRRNWKTQKVNRNIAPGGQGLDKILSLGKERNLTQEKSKCAQFCQKNGRDVQGRSNCPYCQGAGFNAANKRKEAGKGNQS